MSGFEAGMAEQLRVSGNIADDYESLAIRASLTPNPDAR